MGLLGTLLFGALLGGSAIKNGIQNADIKSKPFKYLDDGTPVYLDRNCNKWANGERIVKKYDYDRKVLVEVGERSGKVYFDPQKNMEKMIRKRCEHNKQHAIEMGYLAYMNYDFRFERMFTCEISTGKFISRLDCDKNGVYRKFYHNPNMQYAFERFVTYSELNFDDGVIITEEECKKLDILGGTHISTYKKDRKLY